MRCFPLVLILMFAASTPAEAADKEWLLFPAGKQYAMTEESDKCSVRIPVRPQSGQAGHLKVALIDVVGPGGRPLTLSNSFTAKLDGGDDQRGASLVIEVGPGKLQPGTYTVVVDLAPLELQPATSENDIVQTVSLVVTMPFPELELPSKLYIEQTYDFFGTSIQGQPLKLLEKSRQASLPDLKLVEIRDQKGIGPIDTGALRFPEDIKPLNAGQALAVAVGVDGEFTLGTTSGRIEIHSSRLAKSETVPYEVRARRTNLWIYLITAAGFLSGWFIRVFLKRHQELAFAKADASTAVSEILAVASRIPDADFQQRSFEIRDGVSEVFSGSDPEKIRAATTTVRSSLQASIGEFEKRRDEVLKRVESLRSLLLRRWKLTPPLMDLLSQAVGRVEDLVTLVERNAVSDTERALRDIESGQLPDLANHCLRWRRGGVVYLQELILHPMPMTNEGTQKFAKGVEAWEKSFGNTNEEVTEVSLVQLTEALERTHAANVAVRDLIEHVELEQNRLTTWIDQVLDVTMRPDLAENFDALNQLNREAVSSFAATFEAPAQSSSNHSGRMLQLQRSWGEVLRAMLPSGVSFVPVQEVLSLGQWSLAIEKMKELMPPILRGRGIPDVDESAPLETLSLHGPIVFRSTYADGTGVAALVAMPLGSMSRVTSERNRFDRIANRYALVQTMCFAILFMFIADALYAANWVGTSIDMLSLFVWAFGVDVSSEAVMNAAKKVSPGGST